MEKLVSVIIPTVDGDPHIEECIKAVKASTYENVEVIVVNEGLERSAQRNIGIERAKGEYYLILDSDQIISRRLIKECVEKIKKCCSLYIPEVITTKGFFGKLRNWERQFYTGTSVDCVRFVHAKYCRRFDEEMSGPEDSDWDRRIYGERKITKNIIRHKDGVTLWTYFKKKAYYSKSMKRFGERNPKDKVLNFWWRCFGVYLEHGKWKWCARKPHYFVCVMGLNFVRGIIYVWQKNKRG